MKLLGLFLIRCIFTKKTEGAKKGRKFVKIRTGKNIGSPEQCVMYQIIYVRWSQISTKNICPGCHKIPYEVSKLPRSKYLSNYSMESILWLVFEPSNLCMSLGCFCQEGGGKRRRRTLLAYVSSATKAYQWHRTYVITKNPCTKGPNSVRSSVWI